MAGPVKGADERRVSISGAIDAVDILDFRAFAAVELHIAHSLIAQGSKQLGMRQRRVATATI